MEEGDLNAYDVTWNAFNKSPGFDNGALIELSGQVDANYDAWYNAYMSPSNQSMVLTGQALIPVNYWPTMSADATYEANYLSTDGTCAGVSSYQYIGALHDGTFNSLTYVYVSKSTTLPQSWTVWNTGNTSAVYADYPPYHAQALGSNSRAGYEAWGF